MGRFFGCVFVFYGIVIWVAMISPVWFLSQWLGDKWGKKIASKFFWLPYSLLWASGNRLGMWLGERAHEIHRALSLRWPRGVWVIYGGMVLFIFLCNFLLK